MNNNNQQGKPNTINENLNNSAIKDPEDWTTGNEQMTGAQLSYLQTLAQEAGITINENMTKAEASIKIDELQQKTGRGINH